ncbi:MAG TPA: Ig-like domain-containing protein [Caulobacteraceae bacterium]|nr:Ig-like domain-containing protein [Caulobacteraceae bacterium]
MILTFATDTGSSNSDGITSDNTITFTSQSDPFGNVNFYDTGGVWLGNAFSNGAGIATLTTTALSDGSHTFSAFDSDYGYSSNTLSVTIDTAAPSAPSAPDMAAGSDTGSSSTDNITRTIAPTFTGTAEAGATVTLYDTDGTTVLGTATATGGTWSITSSTLSAGSHTLTAKALDTAGNVGGASSGLSVTIDTTAPSAPSTPDMAAGSDSGTSSTDNITHATTPTFTGTAEAGATVSLYDTDGTTVLGTATATGGNWSIVSATLSAGSHTLSVKAADVAGNVGGASSGLSVTIDTTAPAVSAPDLATASDDGASGADNITSATTPTFTGTAEAGATITLHDTDGTTVLGSATATGGTWSITSSALTLGTHTLTVGALDTAGNLTTSTGLSVQIVAPDAPPGPTPVDPPLGGTPTGGADSLGGGSGDDSLAGGGGNDSMAGGAGSDSLDGDTGADTVAGGEGGDFLRGLADNDSINGGAGSDTVNGNVGADTVDGGDGNDTVYGGQGDDSVDGGAGDDGHVNGNLGSDTVHGGDGDDTVYGGQGDDSVYGDAGDDRLSGDLGADILFGGAGADKFAFKQGGGQDWVADFNTAEGDRIMLAPGTAYTVLTFQGQVILDLGGGSTIGLVGVGTFSPDYVVFG